MAREDREDRPLLRFEADAHPCPLNPMLRQVDRKINGKDDVDIVGGLASEHGNHASEELFHAEWLREVVVGCRTRPCGEVIAPPEETSAADQVRWCASGSGEGTQP